MKYFVGVLTSGIVEDMKITQENIQEKLNLHVPIPSLTPLIYRDLMNLDTLLIYRANRIFDIAYNILF